MLNHYLKQSDLIVSDRVPFKPRLLKTMVQMLGFWVISSAVYANNPDNSYQVAQINLASAAPNQVQAVELPPQVMGQLTIHNRLQLQVLDANHHMMPMHIVPLTQTIELPKQPLTLYRWLPQTKISAQNAQQLQIKLQQNTQDTQIITQFNVPQTANTPENTGAEPPSQHQAPTGKAWVLVNPYYHKLPEQGSLHLVVNWQQTTPFNTDFTVLTSPDLLSWSARMGGELMQAVDANGGRIVQNKIEVDADTPYWRIELAQPLDVTQISIDATKFETPVLRQYPITFKPVQGNPSTWLATLESPWLITGIEWPVPVGQVWNLTSQINPNSTRTESDDPPNEQVSNLKTGVLYHAPTDKNFPVNLWGKPLAVQRWQVQGQGPQGEFTANLKAQAQQVWFLPQGTAPYQVALVETPAGFEALPVPQLPEQLKPNQALATLGPWQTLAVPIAWQRYALWVFLGLVVLGLGFMAWRLIRQLEAQPKGE